MVVGLVRETSVAEAGCNFRQSRGIRIRARVAVGKILPSGGGSKVEPHR